MSSLKPAPKLLLRGGMIFCLVCAAGAAIVRMELFGTSSPYGERFHDLSTVCFTLLIPFILLYVEYELGQKITKSELNTWTGYVEACVCLALLLYGVVVSLFFPGLTSDTTLLLLVFILGQIIFLFNVVMSYVVRGSATPLRRATISGARHTRDQHAPNLNKWRWSRSPTQLFAVGTLLFAVIAAVFLSQRNYNVPLPGQNATVAPAGVLALWVVVPFAFYGFLYWLLERAGTTFHELLTRVHFIIVLGAVLDAVRIYVMWARTAVINPSFSTPLTAREFKSTSVFAAVSLCVFSWNVAGLRLERLRAIWAR